MTPRKLNIILWSILGLMLVGIAGGLYFSDTLLAGLAKDTALMKADTEIARSKVATYTKNKTLTEQLSYIEAMADEVLPVAQDQSVVVSEIFHFAAASGVGISGLTFDEVPVVKGKKSKEQLEKEKLLPKGVAVVPISVNLTEGTPYSGVENFLRKLEENRRKMQITGLTMQPSEESLSVFSSVELKINLYTKATSTPAAPVTEDK